MPLEIDAAIFDRTDEALHESVRAERRHFQASKTFRADVANKGINVVVRLLSIPLSLQLLGAERYGLWLTVSSVLMWLNLSQMGLGGGLLNEIGKASASDDRVLMRRHISTAYLVFLIFALLVFAIILGVAGTPIAPLLLGVNKAPSLYAEARALFIVTGAMFAASLLTHAVHSVCTGLQEGYLVYSTFAAGSLLSLVALVVVYWMQGSLLAFAVAMSVPNLVAHAALAVYIFTWRHPDLRPRFADLYAGSLRPLLTTGGAVALVLLGEMTILNSTNPLIADRLGLAQVPHYSVPFSIFMIAAGIGHGMTYAYLAAFCEAAARHDWLWIRTTFLRTCKKALLLMTAVAFAAALAGPYVIALWTHGKVTPDYTLMVALGVYFIVKVLSLQNSVLFIALGRTAPKAALQIFIAAAHIAGFFALVSRFGLLALPLAGTAAYVVDIVVSSFILSRHISAGEAAAKTI